MLVRDIMTSPAVTIGPADDVSEAARVLDRLSLTSLPVVGPDDRILGVIGEADLIGRLSTSSEAAAGAHRSDDVALVRDVMTHRVFTVEADDDVADVVALMTGTTLKSLPVVLHNRVVGVVSRRDVVRAMAHGDFDDTTSNRLSPA